MAVVGGEGLLPSPSSGCSAVAEGGVAVKPLGVEVPCGLELVSDEAEAEEPGAHRVSGVLALLRLCGGGSYFLGKLAHGEAKLDVGFQLSGMQAVLLSVCRCVELEKPELDRALGEGGVEVQHVVAAAVVVLAPAVGSSLRGVPDVCKARHRGRLLLVQGFEEVRVDRSAVASQAAFVKLQGFGKELLVACHDVGEVPEALRCVACRADVDVDPAASCRVALCSGLPQPSYQLLQGFDVVVGKDRGDHLAFLCVWSGDADVPLEFPFAVLIVPCAPAVVSVVCCGVLVSSGSEEVGCELGGCVSPDVVHLNLDPDGLLLHGFLLSCCVLHSVGSFRLGVVVFLLWY